MADVGIPFKEKRGRKGDTAAAGTNSHACKEKFGY